MKRQADCRFHSNLWVILLCPNNSPSIQVNSIWVTDALLDRSDAPRKTLDMVRTALICLAGSAALMTSDTARAQSPDTPAGPAMAQALRAADAERWADAAGRAAKIKDPVAVKIAEWMRLKTPNSGATFDEIAAFLDANPDWPRRSRLVRRAEEALGPAMPNEKILAWFAASPAVSPDGAFQHARALEAVGRVEEAAQVVRNAWSGMAMGNKQADAFRRRFRQYIGRDDDIARLDRLLWEREVRDCATCRRNTAH